MRYLCVVSDKGNAVARVDVTRAEVALLYSHY